MENPEHHGRTEWTGILGIIIRAAYAVGVLYFVAFTIQDYSVLQKLAVLVIAVVIYGAAKAIVHIAWPGSRRRGWGWL